MIKVDLHVHSLHSNKPTIWALRKFQCPESYTTPQFIYRRALDVGMDLVTITDHNTINGALEIAHLPGSFISTEVTAYFPEDGCKVHVVVLGIDEAIFTDLMVLRRNIYEMVNYLQINQISHFIAHPLYAQNDRLTAGHVEKMLLLFNTFEVVNGSRAARFNLFLQHLLGNLTPRDIEMLADRHDIEPYGDTPWLKGRVGGSDDHSGLFIARTFTGIDAEGGVAQALAGLRDRRSVPSGQHGGALTLAHSLYGISYSYYRKQFSNRRSVSSPFVKMLFNQAFSQEAEQLSLRERCRLVLRNLLPFRSRNQDGFDFEKILDQEVQRLFKDKHFLERLQGEEQNRRIFSIASALANRLMFVFTQRLLRQNPSEASFLELIHSLSTIGFIHLLMAPYYLAFHHQHRSKEIIATLRDSFALPPLPFENVNTAVFSDTPTQKAGDNLLVEGERQTLLTVSKAPTGAGHGTMNFQAIGELAMPGHSQLRLHFPPLLDIIDYFERENFNHIHIRTPGTMGLAGMLIGKLLNVPVTAECGKDLPARILNLTRDESLVSLTCQYLGWLYQNCVSVTVKSENLRQRLIEQGVDPARITLRERQTSPRLAKAV
ncbi:MAG: glycosyl transferase family 1 [Desulfuromonadales bacterium]